MISRLFCVVVFWSVARLAAAEDLFAPIAQVLQHPRCMNCHTNTDYPRQGDAQTRHSQNVQRGPEGRGIVAMQCTSCHRGTNQDRVPGAAGWRLAPLQMGWDKLSPAELCRAILDPERNGLLSPEQLLDHMKTDSRVLWAWNPGASRTTPPISHSDFVAAVAKWLDSNAECGK